MEQATSAPAGPREIRRKLLLVEDDRPTYTALRGILNLKGWDVTVATSLAQGLDAVRAAAFSAIVLDLALPDGEGEALLAEVRHNFRSDVPVVVTTGISEARRIEKVTQMKPNALLRKPIQLSDLLNAIADAR